MDCLQGELYHHLRLSMHNSDSLEVKELVAPGDLNVSNILPYPYMSDFPAT